MIAAVSSSRWLALALALAAVLAGSVTLVPSIAAAADGREYAFLRVQGKLTRTAGQALPGASVRLTRGNEVHQATTDAHGFFVFEKLPLGTYEVEVRAADGRLIQRIKRFDTAGGDVTLLEVGPGTGGRDGEPIVVSGSVDGAEILVPEPSRRWPKLWVELLVFLGAGLVLLAL